MGVRLSQFLVKISEEILNLNEAEEFVHSVENGALNMFIGKVRNSNLGREVLAVSYDAFKPLAENVLSQICTEALEQFDSKMRLYIAHHKGRLELGGISVVIAVGSAHRDPSFKACRYIIEQLKIRAPIWKQEHYIDGDDDWLLGHELVK